MDILVNNASVMTLAPTVGDAASYDAAFAVNVRALFLLTALLAEKTGGGSGGSIVNVGSTAAGLACRAWPCTEPPKRRLESADAAPLGGGVRRVERAGQRRRAGLMRTSKRGRGDGTGAWRRA